VAALQLNTTSPDHGSRETTSLDAGDTWEGADRRVIIR
jgi:hypothetical protein